MAKPGVAYPQVEMRATALIDRRVVASPPRRSVAKALDTARRTGADVLVLGRRRAVTRRELERLCGWGLGGLGVAQVAWHGLPVLPAAASELEARRLLIGGAPMILVHEGGRVTGVIDTREVDVTHPALALGSRLDRPESPSAEAWLWLGRLAGKVGETLNTRVFAVGGLVRDLLLERLAPDVDILVEGDAVAFARRLLDEVGGGRLVVHEKFGTASIEGAAGPGGSPFGRIDVASARRERYERPGALPVVSRATVPEDLWRRDFSVNALAMALQPSAFGRVLDPLGGQRDLARRRLRPLHPLSFVEDPTRIFRAARYASRLGFRLDAAAIRAVQLALSVADYPSLSGQRLRAEVDLLALEPSGRRGFELLVKWGALSLWDRGYASARVASGRLRDAERFCAWATRSGIGLDRSLVFLIALLMDQRATVAARCFARLAANGEAANRIRSATLTGPLARRLEQAGGRPSRVDAALRPLPMPTVVGAWLRGSRRVRRRIEWFLSRGRDVRPLLSGDDVVGLGVPRGPEVGKCLTALRRLRLDGRVRTIDQERAFVAARVPTVACVAGGARTRKGDST
jgi:tRNA nucleotidyltransferase (CCA-adding enzyme)